MSVNELSHNSVINIEQLQLRQVDIRMFAEKTGGVVEKIRKDGKSTIIINYDFSNLEIKKTFGTLLTGSKGKLMIDEKDIILEFESNETKKPITFYLNSPIKIFFEEDSLYFVHPKDTSPYNNDIRLLVLSKQNAIEHRVVKVIGNRILGFNGSESLQELIISETGF